MSRYPAQYLIALWLSANRYSGLVASNPATLLSVDFPPVVSCPVACEYCYARRGRQAMPRAVALQTERYEQYLRDPEGYATKLADMLRHFDRCFGVAIGSTAHPLRLFGAGDLGSPRTFARFHAALKREGVAAFGYSRHLGVPGDLWYSADRDTPSSILARARKEGRRIAFVRRPDDVIPDGVDLVFPEHRAAWKVPLDLRDCPKIRGPHEVGVCYQCKRCFARKALLSGKAA